MRTLVLKVGLISSLLAATSCRSAPDGRDDGRARRYEGFGGYHRTISTNSPAAQEWFDQGLQLLYGFNHDEAIRSFRRAAKLDPKCAMAWWGVSYAHGLHINNPAMTEEQSKGGYEAAQRALGCVSSATPVEAALVRAVAERYAWPIPEDRKPLDVAYAAAMQRAWEAHQGDPDVGALFAESLMNLQPWDYWTVAGEPKGRALEIVATLERVLANSPQHPGANHFYIHAVEASHTPERAVPAADRLVALVPGSGHLVHMPSHIYTRVGRYGDAADTNERAIDVDRAYFKVAPPPRFYSLYFLHNVHFLAYAAMMEGRPEKALEAARRIEDEVPEDFLRDFVHIADGITSTKLHVLIRFGRWEDVLKVPKPEDRRFLSRAIRHYARGVAFSSLGRMDEANAELAAFDEVAAKVPENWSILNNPASVVLPIARAMLIGELRFREGRLDEAFASLRDAVVREDALVYDEPPGWMQPVRHALGALLLAAGRPAEAEAVYREDLAKNPENGWSLLGLEQALTALSRTDEARAIGERFKVAWKRAEVQPPASCYCAAPKT